MIGPKTREAILVEAKNGPRTVVVQDGAAIGGFIVKVVDPQTVLLVGPTSVLRLVLEEHADPQSPPVAVRPVAPRPSISIQTETSSAGKSMGILAMERDACARAGLLPGVKADAEARLRRLIGAIANSPGRQQGDVAGFAPTKLIAAGMSDGLDAAHVQTAGFESDHVGCVGLDARWNQAAGRYGLL